MVCWSAYLLIYFISLLPLILYPSPQQGNENLRMAQGIINWNQRTFIENAMLGCGGQIWTGQFRFKIWPNQFRSRLTILMRSTNMAYFAQILVSYSLNTHPWEFGPIDQQSLSSIFRLSWCWNSGQLVKKSLSECIQLDYYLENVPPSDYQFLKTVFQFPSLLLFSYHW